MVNRTPKMQDCFEEGTEARQNGHKLADNPYDLQTDEHDEWRAGFLATFDLDEDDDPDSSRDKPAETP